MIAHAESEPPAAMQASMHFFCPAVLRVGGHGSFGGQPGGGSFGQGNGLADLFSRA